MTVKNPRATKKFKGLVALLEDETRAVIAWNASNPDNPIAVDAPVEVVTREEKKLVDAGFSLDDARTALAAAKATDTSAAPETVDPALSSSEQGEILTAKAGLVPVRGRVYSHPGLVEAQVRVLRSGTPEVVQQPGDHRTKAVLVYRMDDDKVIALQNLGVQN